MKEIEKIVLKMIGTQKNQNQYNLFKLRSCWPEVVGKINAIHCGPVKLERRILFLQADSSVWSNQLIYYKKELLQKVNQFMGNEYVKDVRFSLGKDFKKNPVYLHKDEKKVGEILPLPFVTKEENKAFHLQFSHIKNEKLREAVIRVEKKRMGLHRLYEKGLIQLCPSCGSYLKNGETQCFSCLLKKEKRVAQDISYLIKREPWITWEDIQKIIKCDKILYNIVKNDVKSYYFERVRQEIADEEEKKLAIQLKAEKPLALISSSEYENILRFLQKRKKQHVYPWEKRTDEFQK